MEVMLWEVLLRNGKRRCGSINTRNCWLARATKEGRSDKDDICCFFTTEKRHRKLPKTAVPFLACIDDMNGISSPVRLAGLKRPT